MNKMVTFKEALESRLKNFATYALSLLAAFLLTQGVKETITKYGGDQLWVIWITALVALIFAISVLTLITYLDPEDKITVENVK